MQNDYVGYEILIIGIRRARKRRLYCCHPLLEGDATYDCLKKPLPMLTRSIDNAQEQLGDSAVSNTSVSVSISLSEKVKLDQDSALIVSVHTADGSPMPVAAARYPLGSFPRTVVLDDTNSMLQDRKLSSLESLMVRVRLDSDGNVATKQGDWFGESEIVKMVNLLRLVLINNINQAYSRNN